MALGSAKEVVIRCNCQKVSIDFRNDSHGLGIQVAGRYGSSGYQGKQEKPKVIPAGMLTFTAKNDGSVLTLESKEWVYMHHFNLFTAATITAPPTVAIRFEGIPYSALRNR